MDDSNDFVRFDEIEDVRVSLDLVALLAPLLDRNPSYWKWVVVGAHSALQGAMVCALVDSTGTSVLSKKDRQRMLAWLDADTETRGEYPGEKLAAFYELLDRCTNADRADRDALLVLEPEQLKRIRQLHGHFRNNFAHFVPHHWSIAKADLPRIIDAALDAVEKLMERLPIEVRMSEHQRERLIKALYDARVALPRRA
jgi:hypothetical protein